MGGHGERARDTMRLLIALICVCVASADRPSCNIHTDCSSCASASDWFPGSSCRWCTVDKQCHGEGSMYNKCSTSQNIYDPTKCGSAPAPAPALAPTDGGFSKTVLKELFKLLKITDVDVDSCVNSVGRADVHFEYFRQDLAYKNYSLAATDLARGLSALSTSVATCGVTEVQAKIDTFAAAIKWANVSTAGLDKGVKFVVDASDLWPEIAALATAVTSKDSTAVGSAIGQLLDKWSSVTGGCHTSSCSLLDGLLRVVQVVATDIAPCEAALEAPFATLQQAAAQFQAKNYFQSVADFSAGLDGLAEAISADACGLHSVASTLAKLAPLLANATIKIESSSAVKIIVGSSEVYDEIYKAVEDLAAGNHVDFGMQMGALLMKLQTSKCTTKACTLLQGLLSTLQLELGSNDFTACAADLDGAWGAIPTALRLFDSKDWVKGVEYLAVFFTKLSQGVSGCQLTQLAKLLEATATKLQLDTTAADIGLVAQVLVQGSDVTLDIAKIVTDSQAGSWSSVGHDLGTLSNWIVDTQCTTFGCKLVEGLLNAAAIPLQDLAACESDLDEAGKLMTAGAAAIARKDFQGGVTYWSSGVFSITKAVQDCGLAKELTYMGQEANVLGFGNVTVFGELATIMVHGTNVVEDINTAYQHFASHDYRGAGAAIGKLMNDLSNYTTGHSCTNDFCYVVSGILEFFEDAESDMRACQSDFESAWHNFSAAFSEFQGGNQGGADFHFSTDKAKIKAGVADIGHGLKLVAKGVGDCHLQQFADILAKLAAKLGVAPEVSWVEELLSILINGVEIENELGDACIDYSQGNWVGFGYNVAKLAKTLAR